MKDDNNHNIEQQLSHISFRALSNEERDRGWERIVLHKRKPLLFNLFFTTKPMITSLLIALALSLGIGGTVVTADSAVPGDTLYGLDRAVENLRINIAQKEKKDELRIRFADERVQEIEKIETKEQSVPAPASESITEAVVTEIEADVFTNETIIKIEYSDKKFTWVSDAKTKEAVVDVVVAKYPALSKTFVESKLSFEIEDRASRAGDKLTGNSLSAETRVKVTTGLNTALALLQGVSTTLSGDEAVRLKVITDQLNAYLADESLDNDDGEVRIKEDDNKTRVELRTEDGRVRVEVKNGELRIKADDDDDNKGWDKSDDSDDDSSDDDKSDDKNSLKKTVQGSAGNVWELEVEADVFTNETVVKVEINNVKNTFTTSAKTKAEIVAAVVAKYPALTTAKVEAVLDLEIENRASTLADIIGGVSGGNSDDDSDDSDDDNDSDDKDDDDEDDDDNSGKGKGGDDKDDD